VARLSKYTGSTRFPARNNQEVIEEETVCNVVGLPTETIHEDTQQGLFTKCCNYHVTIAITEDKQWPMEDCGTPGEVTCKSEGTAFKCYKWCRTGRCPPSMVYNVSATSTIREGDIVLCGLVLEDTFTYVWVAVMFTGILCCCLSFNQRKAADDLPSRSEDESDEPMVVDGYLLSR